MEKETKTFAEKFGIRFDSMFYRGRAKLYNEEPFYGLFALNCSEIATERVPTAGVCEQEGTFVLMYNPKFMETLTDKEAAGVIKHEINHIIFGHLSSELFLDKDLEKMRLNVAMDLAVNSCIPPDELPEGGCFPSKFVDNKGVKFQKDLSTMEYYYKLPKEKKIYIMMKSNGTVDKDGNKKGDDHSVMKSESPPDFIRGEVERIAKKVYSECSKTGGQWGSSFADYMNILLGKSQLPWQAIFRRFLLFASRVIKTPTWKKPHRRYGESFQGRKNIQKLDVLIGVDESGSIGNDEWKMFMDEIDATKKTGMCNLTIAKFTTRVEKVFPYRGLDDNMKGRFNGGTTFQPLFDLAETLKPDIVVCFTDGYNFDTPCKYSKEKSVLWCLVPNGRLKEKFGTTIKVKEVPPRPDGF